MSNLGRLEKVDPRNVWEREDGHFTPWLADNLDFLGQTIGIELELQATEQNVGPFRADIVARDTISNNLVLIENQLEQTDHSHMGQLITYAAGLDAVTIVWVARTIRDEHRAALDWLNDVTDESINFFGLEIELWRIGESDIAPKFNITSKPNDWTKTVHAVRQASSGAITETAQLHLEYWTVFKEYLIENYPNIPARKPRPEHWADFAIGRTYFLLRVSTGMRDGYITVELIMEGAFAKPHYYLLEEQKEAIEAEFGDALEWRELPDAKSSAIRYMRDDVDPTNQTHWTEYHAWVADVLTRFNEVFRQRIKSLNADDYVLPIDHEFVDDDE